MKSSYLVCIVAALLWAGCASQPAPEPAPSAAETQASEARARLETSEAGKLLLAAIDAHGGLETWYASPATTFCWEYSNPGSEMRFKTCGAVDNRTRRAYHDLVSLGTPDAVEPYGGRFAWDGEEAWIVPADTPKVNPRFWALTGFYFQQIPFVLADPGVACDTMPDSELGGETYSMIECGFEAGVGDAPGDTYKLYLDQADHTVHAIRYTVTYGRAPDQIPESPRETLFFYEDLQTVDGLTTPGHFDGYWFDDGAKGEFKNEAWATELSYTQPFDESRLAMPEGARVQPMPGE